MLAIRPAGSAHAVADAGPPGHARTLVVQRRRYLDRPELGPVTCMAVLGLPVSPFTDQGGACLPESHPGLAQLRPRPRLRRGPGSKVNGLAGSVAHTAEGIWVLGRCGWTPVETTTADAGPSSGPLLPRPTATQGAADTVLAFDAAGRQVARQVILPPETDCQGTPRRPG